MQTPKLVAKCRALISQWGEAPTAEASRDGLDPGLLAHVPADRMREPRPAKLRTRVWDWVRDYRPEPAPSFIGPVEPPPRASDPEARHRTGICCSGGGIRSAAFNLGALQTLQAADAPEELRTGAATGELQNATYLSAVSGGSYITAAFATVQRRWTPRPDEVDKPPDEWEPPEGDDNSDPRLVTADKPPFYRGSPEEQYLRNRASYLAPTRFGKVLVGMRLLLGLFWNMLFLGAAIAAMGILAGLIYRAEYDGMREKVERLSFNPPFLAMWLPIAIGAAALLLGLSLLLVRITDERWRQAIQAWYLRLLVLAAAVAFVTLLAPLLIVAFRNLDVVDKEPTPGGADPAAVAGWAGILTIVTGILAQLRSQVDTRREVLAKLGEGRDLIGMARRGMQTTVAYAAALIAGPVLAIFAFTLPASWATANDSTRWPWIVFGICAGGFLLAYLLADLTTWSLHPFYKRRLASAFALKRVYGRTVQGRDLGEAKERDYGKLPLITEADVATDDDPWPVPVVCAAANVSNFGATPPGRDVTSFTFSPGAMGGPLVGAVPPREYADRMKRRSRRDLSLLTAVSVSGAALSPSMGKETRWALRALLALANVRLGVWIRNPRHLGNVRRLPRPRPYHLVAEIFGWSPVNGKYLYVTDGGHYENLGLVELLRRGCTRIYCFDASGGRSFGALGDAIALARSEVRVEIDIDPSEMRPAQDTGFAASDFAIGHFTYAPTPDNPDPMPGTLVYVRTVLTEFAPYDVQAFHEEDELFPNHPTTDQLYTDQKFEAYRALGETAASRAHAALTAAPVPSTEPDLYETESQSLV